MNIATASGRNLFRDSLPGRSTPVSTTPFVFIDGEVCSENGFGGNEEEV